MWTVGNTNRRVQAGSDDSEEEGSDGEGEEEEEDKDPFAISDDSEDEAQMAEIRAKTLASKAFQNPTTVPDKPQPEKIARPEGERQRLEDSDAESGSAEDSDDEAFDNIIDATPVTDRTGIAAAQRKKNATETFSASFSRTVVDAPQRW